MLLAVERGEGFAGLGAADDDGGNAGGGPGDELVVEGMEGLARLEHHVIGDIDHIVDAAEPNLFESRFQPGRAGSDFNAPNDAGGVSGAEVGGIQPHGDEVGGGGQCRGGRRQRDRGTAGVERLIARRFPGRCQ